jgi:RNA polymerase sigma-70 factor, ECF subfamily
LLRHHADASDCFQETFLDYVRLSRRQTIHEPGAMLRKIATSRAMDQLRRRIREHRRSGAVEDLPDLPSPAADPLRLTEDTEAAERLRLALAGLPEKQSQVYCLRTFENLSYEEIAQSLGITPQSVGVLLHRTRQRLYDVLIPSNANRGVTS